ncbi:MAG: DUF4406 domain-containing protein [Prevotellaceae bacterium]|jgi:hypothetical protein|nr:DUF4406 domain-containing protein [Prevotellaceae bacterium]
MKLYISGKITGDKNYRKKFAAAEKHLINAGYEVVNPAKLCGADTDWNKAMRICIKAMMDCDGVALLGDWKNSTGARTEHDLGLDVGMQAVPIWYWLGRASELRG